MLRSTVVLAAALALALTVATPAAHAQLTSPIPPGTNYLYSVAGVINTGGLGTYFDCTSTSADPQTVSVEVFAHDGTASGSGTLVVGAGTNVRFGTQNATGLPLDSSLASGLINGGAARILSTSKKLLCHAFVSTIGGPVPTMSPLTIVAKLKQKAAN